MYVTGWWLWNVSKVCVVSGTVGWSEDWGYKYLVASPMWSALGNH